MSGALQELAKNLALSGFGSISVFLQEDCIEGPLLYVQLMTKAQFLRFVV